MTRHLGKSLAAALLWMAWTTVVFSQPLDPLEIPLDGADYFTNDNPEGVLRNPAELPQFTRSWICASHRQIFWGLGEPLNQSKIEGIYSYFRRGVGINFTSQSLPIESRWKLALSYAQKISSDATAQQATNREGLFLGATAEILLHSYDVNPAALADPQDPLFASKDGKSAVNLSLGAALRKPNFLLHGGIYNLLMPNLAIGEQKDALPIAVQLGAVKRIKKFLVQANLRYSPRYHKFWADFDPVVGASFSPAKNLFVRAKLSAHSAGFGIDFAPKFMKNFALAYDFSFPLEGIGIPSHNFGIKYLFAPPEPIFPDVVPGQIAIAGKPVSGETLDVAIPITNIGKFRTGEIPVAISFGDSAVAFRAEALPPGKSETLRVRIPAAQPGDLKIKVFLNRTEPSRDAPKEFVERDPDNNFADTSYHIFAPPHPEIAVKHGQLRLIQKFSIAEDEPLVPIFFFEQNDSALDPRFDRTVEIIARRLAENPDVELEIAGFVIDGEPDSLAFARARAVRNALVSKYPGIAPRVKISTDHDIRRLRAKKQKFQGTRVGKIYTPQENRRAELYVRLIGKDRFHLSPQEIPGQEDIAYIVKKLEDNPELILVVRAQSIRAALDYKEKLIRKLPETLAQRVFSQEGYPEGIELVLSPAGLIYRPPQVIQPAEGYETEPGWDRVEIEVKPNGEVPAKSVEIFILNGPDTVRRFSGRNRVVWDWHTKDGEYPPPGTHLSVKARVVDTLGQVGEAEGPQLDVVVKNINEVQQRLILLQFAFAGKQSESEYTNARMEYVARRVIERISAGDVDVIVAGHTDTIGTFAGNQKLSEKRAEEQLGILKKYLMAILRFDSDSALARWIAEHNATLRAEGFGMSQPYTITRLSDGTERKILLGINTLPEGRIKNRRVEILFIPRKKAAEN